jgi:predicted small secreted protein
LPKTPLHAEVDLQRFSTLVALFSVAALGALTACNTVEGVGRDASGAGRSLSSAADQGSRDIHASPVPGCADALHQDRPGGTDYHGPPVPECGPQPPRRTY